MSNWHTIELKQIIMTGLLVLTELGFLHWSRAYAFNIFVNPWQILELAEGQQGERSHLWNTNCQSLLNPLWGKLKMTGFLLGVSIFRTWSFMSWWRERERVRARDRRKCNYIRIVNKSAGSCNVCETEWEQSFSSFLWIEGKQKAVIQPALQQIVLVSCKRWSKLSEKRHDKERVKKHYDPTTLQTKLDRCDE